MDFSGKVILCLITIAPISSCAQVFQAESEPAFSKLLNTNGDIKSTLHSRIVKIEEMNAGIIVKMFELYERNVELSSMLASQDKRISTLEKENKGLEIKIVSILICLFLIP